MRTIARFMDARSTTEGKLVSVLLSALLIISFLNVAMFTDFAGAAEVDTPETNEASELKDQITDKSDTETDGPETEGKVSVQNETTGENTSSGNETDSNESGNQDPGSSSNTTQPGENNTTEGEGEESTPTAPGATFDATTGTLTITGIDYLDQAAALAYVAECGTAAANVQALVLKDVVEVAPYAFHQSLWTALESVNIDNTKVIGDHAFSGARALKSVTLTRIGKIGTDAEDSLKGNAFAECRQITSLTMRDVDFVGAEAFRQCNALSDLTMENVKSFGRSPFSYCFALTSLSLDGAAVDKGGDGIGSLGKTMFHECTGLTNVTIRNINDVPEQMFNGCTALETVVLEDVGTIGSKVFNRCSSLSGAEIRNVSTVGKDAFSNCTALRTLQVENVGEIGETAFLSNKNLKSASLSNVDVIGVNAFASCVNLETVNITDVDVISKYAFYNCKNLESISLNGKVDTIGQYAFWKCSKLTTVNMSDVRFIDNYAFWQCEALTTINSLGNVKERIGGFAFYGCKNLTGLSVADLTKMGFIGNHKEILDRVKSILDGKFQLDDVDEIKPLERESGWPAGAIGQDKRWNTYENGTQLMEQARWQNESAGEAEIKFNAYYTGKKQMDYIFVADLSGSMAQLGNPEDQNARFYDMQSKLLDMTGKLLGTPGYDCRVAIVTFGGLFNNAETYNKIDFTNDEDRVNKHILDLEPLNENTDYGLGLGIALQVAQGQEEGRNTTVVFLSDGAPNVDNHNDSQGTLAAKAIKDLGIDIHGVLHSPTAASRENASKIMHKVCTTVYESTDTESFGKAMNQAFASAYGEHTVTIPINATDFNMGEWRLPEGSGDTVDYADGVLTWHIKGMPFTNHELTYTMNLKAENLNRIGSYSYKLNNENASFNNGAGASVGINLTLSRSVAQPVQPTPMGNYQVVHEYYTDGVLDGTEVENLTAQVGTQILASEVTPRPNYRGNEYELSGSNGSLTVTGGNNDVLVLRYNRTAQAEPPVTPDVPVTPDTPQPPVTPGPIPNVPVPTLPTPNPVTPAAPTTPTATPVATTPAPATTAAAPATAVPTAAVEPAATETIQDNATPQAETASASPRSNEIAEPIAEEETPMGAFDEPKCSTHWMILIGIIATLIYGIVVVRRRLSMAEDISDFENRILGRAENPEAEVAPAVGQQAL